VTGKVGTCSRQARAVGLGLVLALAGSGCAGDDGEAQVAPVTGRGPAITYVALGGTETSGDDLDDPLRDSWSQLFFRMLPRRAVHVNLAGESSTAAGALRAQVPAAVELEPTLATVWLGPDDAVQGTPPERFERDLAEILRTLRAGGDVRVLVVEGPPVGAGEHGPYADQIRAAAGETGAEVVTLGEDVLPTATEAQPAIAAAVAEVLGPIS